MAFSLAAFGLVFHKSFLHQNGINYDMIKHIILCDKEILNELDIKAE